MSASPNIIVQHVPASMSVEPEVAEFFTLAELLAVPWVAMWKDSANTRRAFHRYSKDEEMLMVECDGGRWWWVVGYLARPELVDLPRWGGTAMGSTP